MQSFKLPAEVSAVVLFIVQTGCFQKSKDIPKLKEEPFYQKTSNNLKTVLA